MLSGVTSVPGQGAALFQVLIDPPRSRRVTVVPVNRAQGKLSQGLHHRIPIPNQVLKRLHGPIRMAESFLADRNVVPGKLSVGRRTIFVGNLPRFDDDPFKSLFFGLVAGRDRLIEGADDLRDTRPAQRLRVALSNSSRLPSS